MDETRTRSAAFLLQYLLLLLAALAWVQFDFVQRRMGAGHLAWFYLLVGLAACLLGLRVWLVLRARLSAKWSARWLWLDMAIITCTVYLTGGINSEAALLYLWPIVTSSIRRLPRRILAASAASAVLYLLASWSDHGSEKYLGTLLARLVVLLMATGLAIYYSRTESAHIEELGRLREEVALADYRARLSQEMHDGLQHYLASIAVRLELARKLADTSPTEAARLAADQRFAVRQALAELRYVVQLLRSPAVEREGFVEALGHHLSLLAGSSSLSLPLAVEGEVRPVPSPVAQAAFRIVQEAMMNVERHARATEAKVTLRFEPKCFACTVVDDGAGFDAAAPRASPKGGEGFGLPGMAQRAAAVGGTVEVTSAPGRGTTVAFTAPLTAEGIDHAEH